MPKASGDPSSGTFDQYIVPLSSSTIVEMKAPFSLIAFFIFLGFTGCISHDATSGNPADPIAEITLFHGQGKSVEIYCNDILVFSEPISKLRVRAIYLVLWM